MKMKLEYFKESGKYYAEGEYDTELKNMFQIVDEVSRMKTHPGLSCKWNGIIHIEAAEEIAEDNFSYPCLIFMNRK